MTLQTIIILLAYFTLWYIVGIIIKNALIVDDSWGRFIARERFRADKT